MAKSMGMNLGGFLSPRFMETAPDLVEFSSTFRVHVARKGLEQHFLTLLALR